MKRFGVMLDHFWQWQDIAQVRQPIFLLKIALFRVHRFFISGLSFRREGQKKRAFEHFRESHRIMFLQARVCLNV